MANRIRVFISDPHPVVLAGVQHLLQQNTQLVPVGHCESLEEVPECCERLQPNVVLLGHPVEAVTTALRREGNAALTRQNLLLLSMRQSSAGDHAEAVRAGVRGIFLKEAPLQLLPEAMRQVSAGNFWCDPSLVSQLVSAAFATGETMAARRGAFDDLTARQRRIAEQVLQGRSNGEIAHELMLSQATVARELTNIYEILDVEDRVQLVIGYKT